MSRNAKKRVFVAMSGGVDSSVAALLLKQEGYDVTGVHMICADTAGLKSYGRIEHPDTQSVVGIGVCKQAYEDRIDAMRVCAKLEIPFLSWDFRREYKAEVFNYMVSEYKAGRTPNPDVMCNKQIKFGIFLKRALEAGADFIATGHYIRNLEAKLPSGSLASKLIVAKDLNKDQSYFLWTLTQEQLKYCLFPIGDYLKSEVRELARKFDLPTSEKKDSQGLCFVGSIDFGEFLRSALDTKKGDVIKKDGTKIGEHDGAQFYTIGQRHGLNIGGYPMPLYVSERNIQTNTITVAEGEDDPILFQSELYAENIHWISPPMAGQANVEQKFSLKCLARIRYRQPLQEVMVQTSPLHAGRQALPLSLSRRGGEKIDNNLFSGGEVKVVFKVPQRAVASGQSIVFYLPAEASAKVGSKDVMLGGGIIQ